jgi:hypothetical protein
MNPEEAQTGLEKLPNVSTEVKFHKYPDLRKIIIETVK